MQITSLILKSGTKLVSKLVKQLILLALIIFSLATPHHVLAQNQDDGPVYIVQSGDTLNIIAARFGVSTDDLIRVNQIQNPNLLSPGDRLVIPGLQGINGVLTTRVLGLGESFNLLARQSKIAVDQVYSLNKVTSPAEAYSGASIIIPVLEGETAATYLSTLKAGQSLLELSVTANKNPWEITGTNALQRAWSVQPGGMLALQGSPTQDQTSPISNRLNNVTVSPLPFAQGNTVIITVETPEAVILSGTLNGYELHFFQSGENQQIALQGIHAMAAIGLAPLTLKGQFPDGSSFAFEQLLLLRAGGYVEDPPLYVAPETIDPQNTKPEDDQVKVLVSPATPEKYWNGLFFTPVDEPVCIYSWYGNRRSYNGSEFNYFHTGVDYGVCANLNIYAPASGVVVFAGPLTVRGNATIIDHGWGVYSGFWHQAEIQVNVGDRVETGQLIGQIGGTGRVTGPHLHWEIWVNGVQVQPIDWLDQTYP